MKFFLPALCGCGLLFMSLASHQTVAQVRESRPVQVVVKPVQFEHERTRVEAVGTAEAERSVVLYPAVADRVTAVNFKPGDKVEKGQVLVQLDARRQRVALDRAKILLEDAERTVSRLADSRKQGAIPQSQLDDAVTLRDLAKVELAQARTELEDRQVVAPFDGVVGLTDVELGDRITLQTAITSIDSRRSLFINFRAPEAALDLLLSQATLSVQPWQSPDAPLEAKVAEVDSRIDSETRTVRARAVIDNKDDQYRPGMSFRVNLELAGRQYAAIPEAALLWGATSAYVWKVEQGKAKQVDIQIRQRLQGRLLVSGDLARDDVLIVEGVQSLRDGQAITYSAGQGAAQ